MKREGLYAGVGAILSRYEIDINGMTLEKRDSVHLPSLVQDTCPHASRPLMYVASSNWVSPHEPGTEHYLSVLRTDPTTGAPSIDGSPVRLSNHPVHLTTDRDSKHLLVACNLECDLQIYRIKEDGAIGERVPQRSGLDLGVFAHEIRVTADNKMAILVTRGNPVKGKDAHKAKQIAPGALKVFQYENGVLGEQASVAPGGGYHFGARNLAFHPTAPWVFVSLETQNKLVVFKREENRICPEPLFERDTLATPDNVPTPQVAGTLRVHPNGRFVYCVNRGYTPIEYQGKKVLVGADNTFAVFSIDEATGEPTVIQHIDSGGIFTRTFAIDRSGKMLVACNCVSHLVKDGDGLRSVPLNLSLFEVKSDGTLRFARSYDMAPGTQGKHWMWMCMDSYDPGHRSCAEQ